MMVTAASSCPNNPVSWVSMVTAAPMLKVLRTRLNCLLLYFNLFFRIASLLGRGLLIAMLYFVEPTPAHRIRSSSLGDQLWVIHDRTGQTPEHIRREEKQACHFKSIHVNPPSLVRSLRHFGIAENLHSRRRKSP